MNKAEIFFNSFISLDKETSKTFLDLGEKKTFRKKDFLFKENKIATQFAFLLDGHCRGFVIDIDGKEVTTKFYFTTT